MDLDDEHDDHPEQFSEESRAALESATAALVEGLQRHTQAVLGMRGGSKETPAVFAINEEVERLVDEWNDRVLDHTGTYPLALITHEDDEDDEDEDLVELGDGTPVAVVSRFDLVVTTALRSRRPVVRRISDCVRTRTRRTLRPPSAVSARRCTRCCTSAASSGMSCRESRWCAACVATCGRTSRQCRSTRTIWRCPSWSRTGSRSTARPGPSVV